MNANSFVFKIAQEMHILEISFIFFINYEELLEDFAHFNG